MNPLPALISYKCHRFPAEIISHCVWLYFRFCLSYHDVEDLMAERGVTLICEAVRYWCRKCKPRHNFPVCAILDEGRLWYHLRGISRRESSVTG